MQSDADASERYLSLSATYDAAFDKKIIGLDEDYRPNDLQRNREALQQHGSELTAGLAKDKPSHSPYVTSPIKAIGRFIAKLEIFEAIT